MNTIPLITSGVSGPLGVQHLPRLWQKVSLENAGKLNSEYPAIGGGFDQMVLDGLGVKKESFSDYMLSKPTYTQLESWIIKQSGGPLNKEAVTAINKSMTEYLHTDETRKEILSSCGLKDDETVLDAINLNNLDDWQSFHSSEIA